MQKVEIYIGTNKAKFKLSGIKNIDDLLEEFSELGSITRYEPTEYQEGGININTSSSINSCKDISIATDRK